MAATPTTPDRRAELRERWRVRKEQNAKDREEVRRAVASLRRIAAELRVRGR